MQSILKLLIGMVCGLMAISSFASDEAMLAKLKAAYPATNFSDVNPSEIDGVWEVTLGNNLAYTDESGRYLLFGHVFDMKTQTDLTAAKLETLNKVEWPKDYEKYAIKEVHGSGTRKLMIFSDPDCPYCQALEQELPKLQNVTIYTMLIPLVDLHPDAKRKAIAIWCSIDRTDAWRKWMHAKIDPGNKSCPNPIADMLDLAKRFKITGTPTMISEDGRIRAGSISAEALDAWLGVKG